MPDFDQIRTGLPGNGEYYCAPTACTNVMGYIADHGWPAMMGGVHDWQSQSNFTFVTNEIIAMGNLMGCTASGGTGSIGKYNGLKAWMTQRAPGLFTVTQVFPGSNPLGFLMPALWYGELDDLQPVAFCYGRYRLVPGGTTYQRNIGHCVTLAGITNAVSSQPTVYFRDPADDSTLATQSPFVTAHLPIQLGTITMASGGASLTMWELMTGASGTRCFIDDYNVIDTVFALWPDPAGIIAFKPFHLSSDPSPDRRTIPPPAGLQVSKVLLNPDASSALVVTAPTHATPARLYRLALHDGSYQQLMNLPSETTPIAVGRKGDIYMLTSTGALGRWNFARNTDGSLRLQADGSVTPPAPIDEIAVGDVNESNDQIIAVCPSTRQMSIYSPDLRSRTDFTIPTTVQLAASNNVVQAGPPGSPLEGKYGLLGANHLYILSAPSVGTALQIDSSFIPTTGSIPVWWFFTDSASLVYMNNGRLVEMEQDQRTFMWGEKPGSLFTGQAAGPMVCISRSRTGYDATLYGGPEWQETIDVLSAPETSDYCRADFNGDGDRGTDADIDAFFRCLGGDCCPLCGSADFDGDGNTGTDADIAAFFRVLAGGAC
jgi:hypothetical protein